MSEDYDRFDLLAACAKVEVLYHADNASFRYAEGDPIELLADRVEGRSPVQEAHGRLVQQETRSGVRPPVR